MRYLDTVISSFPAAFSISALTPHSSSQMCTNSPEGLLAVEGKNNTLDLCQTICEYVQASRWEIGERFRWARGPRPFSLQADLLISYFYLIPQLKKEQGSSRCCSQRTPAHLRPNVGFGEVQREGRAAG